MESNELLCDLMKLSPLPMQRARKNPTRPYKMKHRTKGNVKLQRPEALKKLLGITFADLDREVKSVCCQKWRCYSFIDTRDVLHTRAKNAASSLSELYSWTAAQLESFQTKVGSFQYMYRTEAVCRTAWQRIHGISDAVLSRAHKLLANNSKVFAKNSTAIPETEDLVAILLCEKFANSHPEICSDGVWRLQEMAEDAGVQKYVRDHWKEVCLRYGTSKRVNPDKPPTDNTINKVWKADFSNVKFVRGNMHIID